MNRPTDNFTAFATALFAIAAIAGCLFFCGYLGYQAVQIYAAANGQELMKGVRQQFVLPEFVCFRDLDTGTTWKLRVNQHDYTLSLAWPVKNGPDPLRWCPAQAPPASETAGQPQSDIIEPR